MTLTEELIRYSHNIVDGNIIACRKHRQTCKRFLDDIEKQNTKNFPYKWNEKEAEKIVKWFSYLRHSKGILAGKPIILNIWQKFCVCNLYGWHHIETGYRRFTKGFIEVGRKNAKSQMMAGIALYETAVTSVKNNELNEIYTAGTKRQQSKIIFEEAKLMLKGSPLKKYFKIFRNEIRHKKTDSFIMPLSKEDGKSGDGTNPQLGCLDEYHQHQTTEFYDLFDTGMKARKEPLLLIISTAGTDLTVPMYTQEYKYCSNILNKNVENNNYFVMICELDAEDKDNIEDEENWIKANPIVMTYPEGIEGMRQSYQIATEIPEKMSVFLTKNLNIWVQMADNGYMDMEKWKLCEVDSIPYDLDGRDVYVGVDLSAKIDLTSVSFLFPILDKDIMKFILFSHSFIPRGRLSERMRVDKQPYDLWERQGYLSLIDCEIVDQKYIIDYIIDTCKKNNWNINTICVDPANGSLFMTTISDMGYNVLDVWQSHKSLNDATVGFREQVYMKNILYVKNPLLTYAMANTRIKSNNGMIKIDKDATKQRIDPVDATLCAYKLAMFHKDNKSPKLTEDYIKSFYTTKEGENNYQKTTA